MSTLYAIRHKATGKYYLASSMAWDKRRSVIPRLFERNLMPKVVSDLSPSFGDWELVVLRRDIDTDKSGLKRLLAAIVAKRHASDPAKILNPKPFAVTRNAYHARVARGVPPVLAATDPPQTGSRSKLVIHDGSKRLTYREAAQKLGCLADTLAKRLQNMRRRQPDLMSVPLSQLAAASKRARAFWK